MTAPFAGWQEEGWRVRCRASSGEFDRETRWSPRDCRRSRIFLLGSAEGPFCDDNRPRKGCIPSPVGPGYMRAEASFQTGAEEVLAVLDHQDPGQVDPDGPVARCILSLSWPNKVAYGHKAVHEFVPEFKPDLTHRAGSVFEAALVECGLAKRYGDGIMITEFGIEILWLPPQALSRGG